MAAKLARQADFDQIVKDGVDDGLHTWEEAIQEAKETFEESGYDMSALFVYRNQNEHEIKQQMELRFKSLEDVASGKDSLVNMTFTLQGLMQTCRSNDPRGPIMMGIKKLFEQRKGFHTVLAILKEISRQEAVQEEEGEDRKASGEEDSDQDEPDDFTHYRMLLLEAMIILLHGEFSGMPSSYRDVQELLMLTEDEAVFLAALVEEVSDEDRLVFGLLELLDACLKVRANAELLVGTSIVAALELVQKLHKKKDMVLRKASDVLKQLK